MTSKSRNFRFGTMHASRLIGDKSKLDARRWQARPLAPGGFPFVPGAHATGGRFTLQTVHSLEPDRLSRRALKAGGPSKVAGLSRCRDEPRYVGAAHAESYPARLRLSMHQDRDEFFAHRAAAIELLFHLVRRRHDCVANPLDN